LRLFAEKGKKDAISSIRPRRIAYRAHRTLPAFGSRFSCKLAFLVTQAQNRSYAILALQKLQDFYNIPLSGMRYEVSGFSTSGNSQKSPRSREK
jgi:hypothetical protein